MSAFERAADFGCDELYRCPGAAYCDRTTGFCGIDPNAGEAFVQATLDWTVIWSFLGLELSYAPRFARGPPTGPVPRKDPKVGGGNKNLTFDFEGVAMPADSRRRLAHFYATFDTSVFDAVI